jgi:chemotaxis protein methyltransferase CheR
MTVLHRARQGLYPMERAKLLPPDYLKRFCLKGTGARAGSLLVERALRDKVRWMQVNLTAPLPDVGTMDAIFLRNVMIYFDLETKRAVVRRLVAALRPGGWFFVSHSENLHGVSDELVQDRPSVFRKP